MRIVPQKNVMTHPWKLSLLPQKGIQNMKPEGKEGWEGSRVPLPTNGNVGWGMETENPVGCTMKRTSRNLIVEPLGVARQLMSETAAAMKTMALETATL